MNAERRTVRRLAAVALCVASFAASAAEIVVLNADLPGVGFNDATPATPEGGNLGTTVGEQRLNAFQYAASRWAATLDSKVPIRIQASWRRLDCSEGTAVVGTAGPSTSWSFATGAGVLTDTWYVDALADKLAGYQIDPSEPEIVAVFNTDVGRSDCLAGAGWYYGFDTAHGAKVNLVAVLLHELAHGLGFQNITDGRTGAFVGNRPSIWDHFLYDLDRQALWVDMSDAERAASATNPRRVVWIGPNVLDGTGVALRRGTPRLTAKGAVRGEFQVGTATFGPRLKWPGLSGFLIPLRASGCEALSTGNAFAVRGRIALVDRGGCSFVTKAKTLQDAGAQGLVIADNVPGSPPIGLGGTDATIRIPVVRVSQEDGAKLRQTGRLGRISGTIVTLGVDRGRLAGADLEGRALMYTPTPYSAGSSVSHFDGLMYPNQLMEPTVATDLPNDVDLPADLTTPLLRDIGW
jgi:hypothetical protein